MGLFRTWNRGCIVSSCRGSAFVRDVWRDLELILCCLDRNFPPTGRKCVKVFLKISYSLRGALWNVLQTIWWCAAPGTRYEYSAHSECTRSWRRVDLLLVLFIIILHVHRRVRKICETRLSASLRLHEILFKRVFKKKSEKTLNFY
jgi:hypothetical protein